MNSQTDCEPGRGQRNPQRPTAGASRQRHWDSLPGGGAAVAADRGKGHQAKGAPFATWWRWAMLVAVLACPAPGAAASYVSSVNVPLDHWSYEALEKLTGFGLIQSDIKGSRPYSRVEVARLVREALEAFERQTQKHLEPPALARHLLDRFKREFKDDLAAVGIGDGVVARSFIKPFEEVAMRYVFSQGEPRHFRDYLNVPVDRIDAGEGTPLVYNNEGITYGDGHNGHLQFASSMRLWNVFSAYLQPYVMGRENGQDLDDFDTFKVNLVKGYGKFTLGNVEIEGGRDSLWWGQGRHGSLLLTNNAKPLDLVKLSNPTPVLLPWVFEKLGPFKYCVFFSLLEEDRYVPSPWLGGIRFDFKPWPVFEVGLATTFMFAGEGQPMITFRDFLDIIGLQFGGAANRKVNQLSALDFRLRIPRLRNSEIYFEYGGEDTGSATIEEFLFGDVAYLAGIYVPVLTCDGKTDFRFEFAHNAHKVDQTPGFWYGNALYRTGYTHEGLIMGHHMGGDAMDLFSRLTRRLTDRLVAGVDFDYMERGITLGEVQEEIYQVGGDLSFELNDWITLEARYGFERVENYDLVRGDDRSNHLLMTTVKFRF